MLGKNLILLHWPEQTESLTARALFFQYACFWFMPTFYCGLK